MNIIYHDFNEAHALANSLTNRYGRLALTRAAGEAAAAKRKGDENRSALWFGVITYLRNAMTVVEASA